MDIKVLIIEDEPIARQNLKGMLHNLFPEITVVGETSSVKDSVEFLKAHAGDDPLAPDLIFMDVELSDGNSFDIFKQVTVTAHVIMTTAYSEYAVKAFEAEALDYLLKPLDPESMKRAVGRAKERLAVGEPARIINPRERLLIRLNDQIVPVEVRNIAYFYSEAKNSYLVTFENKSFVLDDSLDTIEGHIDPNLFFRISRSCIINEQAIESMGKLIGGRFRIALKKGIDACTDLTVSRARADAFINWMER
ncbi:MAG: LytTR family DNA-binding domain-containing protein [Bacteroidota bacterium]|nr:LytTR family DNA-binding domain-containing protein [Bacteroidota bacterium]